MPLVTTLLFNSIKSIAIGLPQTELRRGSALVISTVDLELGQKAEILSLTLHLASILSPGVIPYLLNSSSGLVSSSFTQSSAFNLANRLVSIQTPGVASMKSFPSRIFHGPGTYSLIVSNNSVNVDVSVCVTGAIKLYQ